LSPAGAVDRLSDVLGGLAGRTVAILGITYKAGTDDVSHSPALGVAERLRSCGARVSVYDPHAPQLRSDGLIRCADPLEAVKGADAVVLGAEWPELANLDLAAVARAMRGSVLLDGRGMIPPARAAQAGLRYLGFGRGGRQRTT